MFTAVLQLCLSRSVTLSLVAALANDERNCKTRRTAVDVLCWNSWPSLPLCFARLFGSFCAVIRCDIIMIEDEELWLITCQTSCLGLLEANDITDNKIITVNIYIYLWRDILQCKYHHQLSWIFSIWGEIITLKKFWGYSTESTLFSTIGFTANLTIARSYTSKHHLEFWVIHTKFDE